MEEFTGHFSGFSDFFVFFVHFVSEHLLQRNRLIGLQVAHNLKDEIEIAAFHLDFFEGVLDVGVRGPTSVPLLRYSGAGHVRGGAGILARFLQAICDNRPQLTEMRVAVIVK